MTEFMLFYASAKLERKCPRGRLLEKYANHTQIAGDISLGISLGASRVAPGILFWDQILYNFASDAPSETPKQHFCEKGLFGQFHESLAYTVGFAPRRCNITLEISPEASRVAPGVLFGGPEAPPTACAEVRKSFANTR